MGHQAPSQTGTHEVHNFQTTAATVHKPEPYFEEEGLPPNCQIQEFEGVDAEPSVQPLFGHGLEPSDIESLDGHIHARTGKGADCDDAQYGQYLRGLDGCHGVWCVQYDRCQ